MLYAVPRVKSVVITPNPIVVKADFIISVLVEEVMLDLYPYASFADGDNFAGSDYIEKPIGSREITYAADGYAGEETSVCQ
jgi:hypothetical protein